MPRLSNSLLGSRHPNVCQSCGRRGEQNQPDAHVALSVWRECDSNDKPDRCVVVLCEKCEKKIVPPHPRLYIQHELHQPCPGAMLTCADCVLRHKLRCTHPDLKRNGGEGLILDMPTPRRAHFNFGGGRGEVRTIFLGPVTCTGKQIEENDESRRNE
jgi:hypothetical protein